MSKEVHYLGGESMEIPGPDSTDVVAFDIPNENNPIELGGPGVVVGKTTVGEAEKGTDKGRDDDLDEI